MTTVTDAGITIVKDDNDNCRNNYSINQVSGRGNSYIPPLANFKQVSEELDTTRKKLERDENGKLLPGQESLNPKGRPLGSVSIIGRAKQMLRDNPEKLDEIAKDLLKNEKLRIELIRQIDGAPKQQIEADIDLKLPFNVNIEKYGESDGEDS